MTVKPEALRIQEILAAVKPLAAEYHRLTGKPLGVTGEVAEYIAADLLGLELAPARTAGYEAIRRSPNGPVRIQSRAAPTAMTRNRGSALAR